MRLRQSDDDLGGWPWVEYLLLAAALVLGLTALALVTLATRG